MKAGHEHMLYQYYRLASATERCMAAVEAELKQKKKLRIKTYHED